MKYAIIAAAAASLALGSAAYAAVPDQEPAIQGNTASDYGESPSGANLSTTQPSGGKASDGISAPTTGLAGSTTGAANMNGSNRNGQPTNPHLQNGDGPAANGY